MPDPARGSCLCGAVAYEVTGAFAAFFLCHCSRCRKGTGTAHGANLFAPGASLTWLCGADHVRPFHVEGTRHARSFCTSCGSALPCVQMDGTLIVVPAGGLDTPVTTKPTAHICTADRADWDNDLASIATLPGLPG